METVETVGAVETVETVGAAGAVRMVDAVGAVHAVEKVACTAPTVEPDEKKPFENAQKHTPQFHNPMPTRTRTRPQRRDQPCTLLSVLCPFSQVHAMVGPSTRWCCAKLSPPLPPRSSTKKRLVVDNDAWALGAPSMNPSHQEKLLAMCADHAHLFPV